MEVLQHRRKAVTYGKSRKKLDLDSIFDDEIINRTQIRAGNSPEQDEFRPLATTKRTPDDITIQGHNTMPKAYGQHSRPTSPLITDHNQDSSDSTSSRSSHQDESASSSILDMLDSDEEACAQQLQPVEIKRRKITPLSSRPTSIKDGRVQKRDQAVVTTAREPQKHRNAAPNQKKRLGSRQVRDVIFKENKSSNYAASGLYAKQTRTETAPGPSKTGQKKQAKPSTTLSLAPTTSLPNFHKMQQSKEMYQDQDRLVVQQSLPKTPRVGRALQKRRQLPRPVGSPSQLGLTSLRLTPDKNHLPTTPSPENDAINSRRARQRLRDGLDALEGEICLQSVSPGLDDDSSAGPSDELTAKRKLVPQSRLQAGVAIADVLTSPKNTRAANDRSKLTYAKQRSHLSDMVDELDGLKAPQPSRLVPSIPALPLIRLNQGTAVIQEFDDSDEVSAANAVRSIHELRQAGINNRFERDLETMFEDIEPHSSPSKALRIQALLQLIQKLQQPSFARQFVEVGMTRRLAGSAQADLDTVSAVLLIHALSSLLLLDHMSAQHVLAAFRAIISLSPSLLAYNESFNKLVTDRKQNLSKALSRELVDFSKATLIGPSSGAIPWTPQRATLFALEHSLRIVRAQKTVPAEIPTALFNQILVVICAVCDKDVSSEPQLQFVTAALSILEFSAVSRNLAEHEEDGNVALNYNLLADVVTKLTASGTTENADLRSIALRLVVSLTNTKPLVCTALAATGLIPAVFVVIQQEFPRLSENADRGDEFDNSKLDLVIMALGCLLNLADCSSEARKRMHDVSSMNSSIVQWLVSVFNERAGKAAEATTIAQSQVLVAFGYLSMLLCTVCIESYIFGYVAASIQGKDLTALVFEAEEFLEKLETVASMNPNDQATSTFNERFRGILVNLSARVIS